MFCKLLITIVLLNTYTIKLIQSQYLDTEISYQKPKLEKNNIVNKGVWVRNKFGEDLIEKEGANNFIFRENSLDVDNLLQNNFDAFGGNYMQDIPFVSAYAERQKRSSSYWNKRPRKSIIGKNLRTRLSRQNNEFDNVDSSQLKVINDLQPSSVFNEYPYEVAILSNNNITQDTGNNETVESTTQNPNINDIIIEPTTKSIDTEIKNTSNESNKNITYPKRSMKYDFETEIIKKIEFTEDLNKTENNNDNKVIDRSNVFDKDNSEWHQNAPIPDVNMYKVVPKEPMHKSKPVTERGLLKVISMLTKTFKKIIKEHNEIKDIHTSVTEITEEFKKNTALFASKFQDFDLKYLYLLKFHDKMKEFDEKLATREDYFLNKEKDMAKNFKEFENQQKKFLIQQKQFYNIQKLMLAQNEKINSKQNLIAKTQSEISHRQNNFARILKKAKQLYTDRNPAITKLSSTLTKLKDTTPKTLEQVHIPISTQAPDITTESVKINLFSIPASNKLRQDPDELLLKEKDDQAIDDLVYKYYFNNTFIDSFMRSKILNSFMGNGENGGNTSSAKHKRNNLETTILLPVLENNESEVYGHKRERRWINRHHSRHSKRRRDRKTTPAYIINITDSVSKKPVNVEIPLNNIEIEPIKDKYVKRDPFLIMAASFCNEIHQNSNQQTLRWCIEKALRRLKFLETGMMPTNPPAQPKTTASILKPSPTRMKNSMDDKQMLLLNMISPINMEGKMPTNGVISTTKEAPSVTIATLQASDSTTPPIQLTPLTLQTVSIPYNNHPPSMKMSSEAWPFPDNDELEWKIKEYDLTPDTEGNVYYEGSIHASDIVAESESGVDDIMPGLDSNSRVEVDPMTFDLQAKRRASVRKLNERIKTSLL